MKLFSSIKHQVLTLLVSLTFGLTILYFSLAITAAFIVEDMLINNLLSQQAKHVEDYYQGSGKLPENKFSFIQAYKDSGQLPANIKQSLISPSADNELFTNDENHFHYKKLQLGNDKPGYLIAEVSDLLVVTNNPIIFTMFLVGLFITLSLAVYLSFKFSKRIVNPVISLANTVKTKQLHNEKQSLTNSEQGIELKYELGFLAQTIDETFAKLTTSFQREKDFTTDVSHELRTPLTVLKNALTLISQRGFKPNDLVALNKVSKQMDNTVTVLLGLARAESLSKERCNVKMMVEQALLASISSDNASDNELNLELLINEKCQVIANPTLFLLLLRNLLDNATEHASSKKLVIREEIRDSDNYLVFENATSEELPPNIVSSGVKGDHSQGVGQGLYLITRIVECFGWQYQLQQIDHTFSFAIKLNT